MLFILVRIESLLGRFKAYALFFFLAIGRAGIGKVPECRVVFLPLEMHLHARKNERFPKPRGVWPARLFPFIR